MQTSVAVLCKCFRKRHCPITVLSCDLCLQLIWKLFARRLSSLWTIVSCSTFQALVFLYVTSLVNNSIVIKNSIRVRTYIRRKAIGYTVQKVTNALTAPVQIAGMPPTFWMVSHYVMSVRTWKLFQVLSRKEDGFDPKLYADDLAGAPFL